MRSGGLTLDSLSLLCTGYLRNNLAILDLLRQFADRESEFRVNGLRCNFDQRHQHEIPEQQTRMRDSEIAFIEDCVTAEQKIQVDGPWAIFQCAETSQTDLDGLCLNEQLSW